MVHGIGMAAGVWGPRRSPTRPPLGLAAAVIAAIAVPLVTACGPGDALERGEVMLSIGYAASTERHDEVISVLTGEGLFRTSPDGHLEPLLAESWEIDDAGTTILVNLRQDVSFHDGSTMTAADVKASLDRDRERGDPRRPLLGDIESIEAQGAHRVAIRLARRSAQLVLFELGVRIEKRAGEGRTVGTGPFQVVARGGNEDTTLRANPYYYQGSPLIDEVRIITYPTLRTAWAAMMRSEIDFLFNVPIEAREFVEADSSVRVFSRDTPYAYALLFNTRRPPFDDRRVRVALSHAIDREAIIESAFRGHGSVASGIWPAHWVYGGVERTYEYAPMRADWQLSEIGFENPGPSEGGSTDEFPSRLRFQILVGIDQARFEPIALLVQRQLRQIGVEMEIDARPFAEVDAQLRGDSWDAVLLPVNTARNLSRLYTYWHTSALYALSGFTGTDDVLESLRSSVTEAELKTSAREFQRVLFEEAPSVFLIGLEEARAVSRRFVVPDEPGRDVVETLWQWRVTAETPGN